MRKNERGAAAVEFALVLPLLVVLAFGIAEFGRAYYLQTTLSGAAREGVRVMAIRNDPAAARSAVVNAASALGVTESQVAVSPSSCPPSSATDTVATVTISYPMTYMTGFFGTAVTLTGKGVMRCGG